MRQKTIKALAAKGGAALRELLKEDLGSIHKRLGALMEDVRRVPTAADLQRHADGLRNELAELAARVASVAAGAVRDRERAEQLEAENSVLRAMVPAPAGEPAPPAVPAPDGTASIGKPATARGRSRAAAKTDGAP